MNSMVSIIVPTKNSAKNIKTFLNSLLTSNYSDFEIIINDDETSSDNTEEVINGLKSSLKIKYLQKNKMMAQARKEGAEHAKGSILLHLDSDMQVTPGLLSECVDLINSGYDALVVPEESIGSTFWAKCKWLEKRMYLGVSEMESLRCISAKMYEKIGGHDERMVFSEDKDLDLRARSAGANIGHTTTTLLHDEGELKLLKTLRKKKNYSETAYIFAEKHSEHYAWQRNIFNRYLLYIKRLDLGLRHPLLYVGLFYMKTAEFAAAFLSINKKR